ncbi:MAG TPA: hypothetical protein VM778_14115 [Gemmatimonadota bacterium]|nr:hypothetical protein [Gemmatimonadota bacterium]
MMLALRIIHIGAGVFWAGSVIFLSFYLMPAVGRAGPDGGRVMQELQKGRLMQVLPAAALATILSGAWLMWTLSGGFHPRFFGSGYGVSLTIGAVASIIAFLIGVTVMRSAQLRMTELAPRIATAADDERARIGAEVAALRARSGRASRAVAWLLVVAVLTMAAARYL